MDCVVHGVTKSQTRLSDFHFTHRVFQNMHQIMQKEKNVAEDKMIGWHHRFNGHELRQTLRDSKGQQGLVCFSPLSLKESDTTWQLNNKLENVSQPHLARPSVSHLNQPTEAKGASGCLVC